MRRWLTPEFTFQFNLLTKNNEAIINCSSAIFEFIARILGSEPTSGDLMPGAPTEMKIALSAIFFGLIGSACAIAEIKLKIDSMDIPEPSIHNLKMKMVGDTK